MTAPTVWLPLPADAALEPARIHDELIADVAAIHAAALIGHTPKPDPALTGRNAQESTR